MKQKGRYVSIRNTQKLAKERREIRKSKERMEDFQRTWNQLIGLTNNES